jgi:hypothetical protein
LDGVIAWPEEITHPGLIFGIKQAALQLLRARYSWLYPVRRVNKWSMLPVTALPVLAQLFEVSVDELLGTAARPAARKCGPDSKLQQQIEQIRQLPRTQQTFVSKMLESVIQQAN